MVYNQIDSTVFIEDIIPVRTITVNVGERIRKFAERMERDSLTSIEAIIRIAGEELETTHPLLPHTMDSISRFEGMIKPGIYRMALNTIDPGDSLHYSDLAVKNARIIIETLLDESAAYFSVLDSSNGLTPYQKVILASIVEKEAVMNQCYDSIASVFYNRLKFGYPLASCITVEYVLGYHRPFLTLTDIKTESPYNLYINPGLTPTPVCFVSEGVLKAVQQPIQTDMMYFVYDWTDNTIHFAPTASVHDVNAEKARTNYFRTFGSANLRKKYYGVFYEQVDESKRLE